MDAAQTLLIIVVAILAFILLIVGVQVFFILREFKRTVSKINKVLDDTGTITESIATPVSSLSHLLTSFKTGMTLLKLFQSKTRSTSSGHKGSKEEGDSDGKE